MASLWFKDGKLVFSGGKLTFCGSCPCGAPSSCPCTTWPNPATSGDFPCGGLQYQYRVSSPTNYDEIYHADEECLSTGTVTSSWSSDSSAPYTITAVDGASCQWSANLSGDVVELRLTSIWWLQFKQSGYNQVPATYTKITGNTPVGVYQVFDPGCELDGIGGAYQLQFPADTVEVTDVP